MPSFERNFLLNGTKFRHKKTSSLWQQYSSVMNRRTDKRGPEWWLRRAVARKKQPSVAVFRFMSSRRVSEHKQNVTHIGVSLFFVVKN